MPLEIVAPEQKINMSLDDLMKLKNNKPKRVNAKPSPAVNARKSKKPKGTVETTGTAKNEVKSNAKATLKVATSVGASKAKRAAVIANRRGLNTSARASKEDIKKEVKKEIKKTAVSTGGLKISFKPSELNKTTEKEVAQQIKAVLSRQSGTSNPGSNKSIASHSSNESKPRNPKVQGKNNVIRLKR